MPQRQPVSAIHAAERPLLEAYARAWERVVEMQDGLVNDPAQWRKARKLREAQRAIEAELARLDAQAYDWFSTEFPRVYAMGVNAGAAEIAAPAAAVWNQINTEAVAKLANEGFGELLRATRRVRRTTKALIREVLADETMAKLIAGDTAKAAGRRAAKILERRGVHAVQYRDGSRHGLKEYAEMAVRTKTAIAYNVGTLDAQESQGVRLWEVFDGICGWTSHDDASCNGMIVTRDEALAWPISHPNCRRAFGGRPDLENRVGHRTPGRTRSPGGRGPASVDSKEPAAEAPQTLVPTAVARERARKRTEARLSRRKAMRGR